MLIEEQGIVSSERSSVFASLSGIWWLKKVFILTELILLTPGLKFGMEDHIHPRKVNLYVWAEYPTPVVKGP